MAKYKVLVDSVIGPGLVRAGTLIDYDGVSEGEPGDNLELVREDKKAPAKTVKPEAGQD
jgi:hypothetical protein